MRQRPSRLRRLALVVCAVAALLAGSGCDQDGQEDIQRVVDVLTAAKYELSVLSLNIQGINESWNGTSFGWKERYGRIAQWADDTNTRLDLVVLEEVWLKYRNFAGGLNPFEYETLFELVDRLEDATGARYRIAYAGSTRTALGLHRLDAGQAVIYNADRLRNTTAESLGQAETPITWTDSAVVGTHMRQSHPCEETVPEQLPLCSLIDADGYLTSPFTNASGRWDLVATASAFAFRDDSQSRVLVLNVHNNFNDFEGSWNSLRDLLSASRTRSGDRQLTYAPLVVGDFNVGRATMEEDETGPGDRFEDLAIAGYVESDVIGAALGRAATYAPRFDPVISAAALPREERVGSLCAPPDVLWSDHCALFLTLHPPIR